MAGLLARLMEMASNRDDLVVSEVDDIDSWGFLLYRDGRYHIYINRAIRDSRKTMSLVNELGHYALGRRIAPRESLPGEAAYWRREPAKLEKAMILAEVVDAVVEEVREELDVLKSAVAFG